MYSTSKIGKVQNYQLISRRDNEGVVGEDIRAGIYYPDRRVDIRCTGNHEINSILIEIAGGVTK